MKTTNKKQELRLKNTKERAEKIKGIKSAYLAEKNGIVITDLLQKLKLMSEYHAKIAKDCVGYKNEGKEIYHLSSEERMKELDKSAGIDEITDYITRQITLTAEPTKQ